MISPADERTIERFGEALRVCGSQSYLQNGLTMRSLGHVMLKHGSSEIRVDLRRDSIQPDAYIDLASMDTHGGMSQQGQGRILLMQLFDIADAAGIKIVRVAATKTGVYAHASYYAQCELSRWEELQRALLMNLECYAETGTASARPIREAQAAAAKPIIEHSTGQLGELVDQLRVPTIEMNDTRYPTLAKYLFLHEGFPRSYMAHWSPVERNMARTAFGWVTPAPVPKFDLTPLSHRPPTLAARVSRLARAVLGK